MPAPFAFVEETPIVGSPACKAGLLAGDAILRFGAATCLEDLTGEIVDGKAVRVSVVEAASGKTVSRIVVPCVYDANQPHSLLGCQVADQCPERFMPHPAVEDEWEVTALPPPPPPPPPRPTPRLTEDRPPPSASAAVPANSKRRKASRAQQKQMYAMDDAEEDMDGEQTAEEDADAVSDDARWSDAYQEQGDEEDDDYDGGTSISGDQWSDEERRRQSGGEETSASGSSIAGGGRLSGRTRAGQHKTSVAGASASGSEPGASKGVLACCRLALLVSSAGSLVSVALLSAGPSVLAADQHAMGAAAATSKYSTGRPSEILPALKQDLWRLASVECGNSALPADTTSFAPAKTLSARYLNGNSLPRQPNVSERAAGPVASQAATIARKQRSLSGSTESQEAAKHEQQGWQDPSESVLSVDSFVNTVAAAVVLQLVLCVAGLGLALLPLSALPRLRQLLVVVYPLTAVALWLLLAAATMYCVVFRLEAESLVHRYWQCLDPLLSSATLQQLEQSRKERTAQLYSDVTAAAVLCASGDGFTVLGLFAVCTIIGWRRVLRTSVMLVSALSAAVGAALLALGAKLHADQAAGASGDEITMGVGLVILLTSLLGLNAARREQLSMLRLFAALQCVCGAALLAVLGVVYFAGVEVLVSHAGGWLGRLYGGSGADQDVLTVQELAMLLQEHRLATSTAAVLLLLLLAANASMVVALRWLIAEQGRPLYDYDSVGLLDDDDNDDEGGGESETSQPSKKRPGRVRRSPRRKT